MAQALSDETLVIFCMPWLPTISAWFRNCYSQGHISYFEQQSTGGGHKHDQLNSQTTVRSDAMNQSRNQVSLSPSTLNPPLVLISDTPCLARVI